MARKRPGAPKVKEWLERDQERLDPGAATDKRDTGRSGDGESKNSNNLCSLNISFSFIPLRISSTSVPLYASNARGNFTWRLNKKGGQIQLI